MSKNPVVRTFGLTLIVVLILGALYYLPVIQWGDTRLRKVDILSDLRPEKQEEALPEEEDSLFVTPTPKPEFVDSCKTGLVCIEDFSDSTLKGMAPFYEALHQHRSVSPRAIRIAFFGDSFIEGDILTSDLRALLQQHFGGCGVGFMDITSPINGFRPTVTHTYGGWQSHARTDSTGFSNALQGINNRYFIPGEKAYAEFAGKKYLPGLDTCEVSTFYFKSGDSATIVSRINGKETLPHTPARREQIQACRAEGKIGRIRWSIHADSATCCYGVSLDGHTGISLDNFSLRGNGGLAIRSIPLATLQQFNAVRPYDLIVLQYGLNVATENGVRYDNYYKGMQRVVEYLKEAFPQAGILIVSVGDRANKDDYGNLRTMPGVKNLIRYQQRLAAENHIAFWNMYKAMGGEGSMPRMAESDPPMANKDYTHINFKGGRHLAGLLYETLVYGFEQYERRKEYEAQE